MNKRIANIIINKSAGNSSPSSKGYKISLPSSWMNDLKINEENRQVEISFDGDKIIIQPVLTMNEFLKKKLSQKHNVTAYKLFDNQDLCTLIYADFTDKTLMCKNYTDNLVKTAFGKKYNPDWNDFNSFLEERCIPRSRAGLREYLEAIGVEEYNPQEIIKKTLGRTAEDNQWIEIEVMK